MKTKEHIKSLKELTICKGFTLVISQETINTINEVISLLQQGDKYRQIVEDIEYELNWHKPEEPLFTAKLEVSKDEEYCNEMLDLIANIKQKYFPKEATNGR